MSLNTMARRLSLEVPGISDVYAATLLSEALGTAEDEQLWSFQLKESGWLTPGLLFATGPGNSAGTITATPFSNILRADATAAAAWAAYTAPPLLTSFQIRSPFYSLYNIIGYGTGTGGAGGYGAGGYGAGGYGQGNVGFSYFVIDRPWMEPGGTNLAYMVYQAYFAVPVSNFRRFISARDTTNNAPMDYWSKTQKDLAFEDPQRTIFDDAAYFVPYQVDARPGTSTPGQMLYELWPHPLSVMPYTFAFIYKGPQLERPADTVPYPFTEDMILHKARENAYLWKEAQKGENIERGSGADWKFLAQAEEVKYRKKTREISLKDRDLVDMFTNKWRPDGYSDNDGFATANSQINVGRF